MFIKQFLFALIGKVYEPPTCEICLVLKEQLVYERVQNEEMLKTLTSLLKPVPIIQSGTTEPRSISASGMTWTRRRAELEKQDRERIRVENTSPVVAKSDKDIEKVDVITPKSIDQLELELGVVEGSKV